MVLLALQLISPKLATGRLLPRSQWTTLCIKLLDKHFPQYVPRLLIHSSLDWIWKKFDLEWLFSIVKLTFSKIFVWISTIKIPQDSFNLSNNDLEKYLGFNTVLRRPVKSIMPKVVKISGEIDVCGKPLKKTQNRILVFFNC